MCSAYCLMTLNICTMFHENISNDFQVTERTGKQDRRTDRSIYRSGEIFSGMKDKKTGQQIPACFGFKMTVVIIFRNLNQFV